MANKLHFYLDENGKLLGAKSSEDFEGYMITIVGDQVIMKPYTLQAVENEELAKIELSYKEGIEKQEAAAKEAETEQKGA